MKRIGSAGAVTNAIDYSIWAKAGNVAGYSGSDGKFGTRDSGKMHLPEVLLMILVRHSQVQVPMI